MPVQTDTGAIYSGAALRAYDKAKADGLSEEEVNKVASQAEYKHRVLNVGKTSLYLSSDSFGMSRSEAEGEAGDR